MSEASEVTFTTSSVEETVALGVRLGALLEPGDFIALSGELGAGKTQFARGIAQGAGVDPREVTSPTFAIVSTYRGRLPIHHADFYRIGDADELYATGFFDLIRDGAALVEWAERVPSAIPVDHLAIRIEWRDGDQRSFNVRAANGRSRRLLARWRSAIG